MEVYKFLSAEWLKISEEVAYKKIIGCNNVNKLRHLGMYLHRAIYVGGKHQ
jgi:hypothetical protein